MRLKIPGIAVRAAVISRQRQMRRDAGGSVLNEKEESFLKVDFFQAKLSAAPL